MKGITNF